MRWLTMLMLICALAMPVGRPWAMSSGPAAGGGELAEAQKQIAAKDWTAAIENLRKWVAKDPKSAEGFNLLGFAHRNLKRMDEAFAYYAKALELDPKHRGAHEYVGEAYLLIDNLAKAQEHLTQLDKLCTFGCPELTELKNKIAAYRRAKGMTG